MDDLYEDDFEESKSVCDFSEEAANRPKKLEHNSSVEIISNKRFTDLTSIKQGIDSTDETNVGKSSLNSCYEEDFCSAQPSAAEDNESGMYEMDFHQSVVTDSSKFSIIPDLIVSSALVASNPETKSDMNSASGQSNSALSTFSSNEYLIVEKKVDDGNTESNNHRCCESALQSILHKTGSPAAETVCGGAVQDRVTSTSLVAATAVSVSCQDSLASIPSACQWDTVQVDAGLCEDVVVVGSGGAENISGKDCGHPTTAATTTRLSLGTSTASLDHCITAECNLDVPTPEQFSPSSTLLTGFVSSALAQAASNVVAQRSPALQPHIWKEHASIDIDNAPSHDEPVVAVPPPAMSSDCAPVSPVQAFVSATLSSASQKVSTSAAVNMRASDTLSVKENPETTNSDAALVEAASPEEQSACKESKAASQLRDRVNEARPTSASLGVPKRASKEDADRTFLTSIQFHAPSRTTAKVPDPSPYRRPGTATLPAKSTRPAVAPVTKRDLLRARSAGQMRPAQPGSSGMSTKPRRDGPSSKPRQSPSPPHRQSAIDKRTLFVPPPLCLPSRSLPKELETYLFHSEKESDLKISLFCQHGRHFASCSAELCMDAHEKYRWLTLIHNKARAACELVCDADKLWRHKLEASLVQEVQEKETQLEQELQELNNKLRRRTVSKTRLLKQGVSFYESALPALHRGDLTAQELHASTGWTAEHYENFKRRLTAELDRAEVQRKMFLDQQAHKNKDALDALKNSLVAPMTFLDGMLRTRLDTIRCAVKRIDTCFQYSIKMAAGIGTGKSEQQLQAEASARSPLRNVIIAERLQRSSRHSFDLLKTSLAIIADVCGDVRLMYKGITRDHDPKKAQSRSPPARQTRRSPSPAHRDKGPRPHCRPQSAPAHSPLRRPTKAKKRPPRSATVRCPSPSAALADAQQQRSYATADFEEDEDSLEIVEDVFDDEIADMVREAGGGSLDRGSGSVVEELLGNHPRKHSGSGDSHGQNRSRQRADSGSQGLSVGSEIEDIEPTADGRGSTKAEVMAKAHSFVLSHCSSKNNNSAITAEVVSEGEGEASQNPDVARAERESSDELLEQAFGSATMPALPVRKAGKAHKKKTKKNKKSTTAKKVSELMHSDPLDKPLSEIKLSQRNQQGVLQSLLLAHRIPLHYEDSPLSPAASRKQKPITLYDCNNLPISVDTVLHGSTTDKTDTLGQRRHTVTSGTPLLSAVDRRSSTSATRPSSALATAGDSALRCFHCHQHFPASSVRHLPMPTVGSDEAVLERARQRQKQSGQRFPTFETVHVSTSAHAQHQWVAQQMQQQGSLIAQKVQGARRGSVALQKHDHPFCSWECVKAWALVNCTPQQKYHTDILIDVAAGYTVAPVPATTMSNTQHL